LSGLITPLEAVAANHSVKLTEEERADLAKAIAALRHACNV
jgi:hypothetical protein